MILAVGAVALSFAILRCERRRRVLQTDLQQSRVATAHLQGKLEASEKSLAIKLEECEVLKNRALDLERRVAGDIEIRHSLEERLAAQDCEFARQREEAKIQFESLANRILEQNTLKFEDSSVKSIGHLLDPLKQRIKDFEQKVSDSYEKEARERFALKSELEKMILANQKISEDASRLTNALKGDSKIQGNWGELNLETILEQSGLRKGDEYIREGQSLALKDEDGRHMRPDVIVRLPDDKHIIVDAKVSLTFYERMVNAEDDDYRRENLREFSKSVKRHVDQLSAKHYHAVDKLHSPDFVLMFCPIEAAFAATIQENREILSYAWERRVMVVSPTTLLAGLRTVASVWKTERQNRNAMEIARQGGALYDKFVAFTQDLEKMGRSIDETQKVYASTMKKLESGRGNLISRAERLRELGAKAQKKLDRIEGASMQEAAVEKPSPSSTEESSPEPPAAQESSPESGMDPLFDS